MRMKTAVWAGVAGALAFLVCGSALPSHAQAPEQRLAASTIPQAALMQPAELNTLLKGPASARPLVLQVGSRMLFAESHIAGSEYAGPGASADGLGVLRDRVKALPRNKSIVIYCGCCPWSHCPNIGNAYKELHDMGFTHLRALYLPDNFGANWVSQGFPVDHGQ